MRYRLRADTGGRRAPHASGRCQGHHRSRARARPACPNVFEERQKGLQAFYGDQYRIYLKQMGVATDVVDIIERSAASGRATKILRAGWLQLGIVTGPAP